MSALTLPGRRRPEAGPAHEPGPGWRLPWAGKTAQRAPAQQPAVASRLRGGPPKFPVGIDIGSTAVRWVQLGLADGKPTIVSAGQQPLSTAPQDPQRAADVQQALRQLASQHGLAGEAAFSLPIEDVNLRLLKMPVLPDAEMAQAIRWQIEPSLPPQVPYEQFVVDYLVIQGITSQWESRVLAVSVPRQRSAALSDLARSAGLQLVAIEPDPFAVQSALAWLNLLRPEETVLALHLGGSSSSFSVISKQQLVFSRSVLTTGRSLTQTVAESLRIPLDQAEQMKQQHGLQQSPGAGSGAEAQPADERAAQVAQALASPIENLMVDLLHAFKSFSHQVTQSQIQRFDRVLATGGTSRIPGLGAWLQSRLGVPVELIDVLSGVPVPDALRGSPALSQASGAHMAVALGLACRAAPPLGGPAR